MGAYEPGSRVFAVRNTDETTIYAYGAGVYVGDFPRPGWAPTDADRAMVENVIRECDANPIDLSGYFDGKVAAGEMTRDEADQYLQQGADRAAAQQARPMVERVEEHLHWSSLNPKIVLDGGAGVVWGCECWWAPEDHPRWMQLRQTREVVLMPAPHPAEDLPAVAP